MHPSLMILVLLFGGTDGGKLVKVRASLEAERIEAGAPGEIVFEWKVKPGWSAAAAGMPEPLLQIEAPPSIELDGPIVEGYRDLSRNEFIESPFEQRLKDGARRIAFTFVDAAKPDERLGLSFVGYVGRKNGDEARFVRRRLELTLKPGARAKSVSSDTSDWGRNGTLQIGEKAVAFKLPRADGSAVDLAALLGKKNVIVTTYRAFW